MRPNVSPGPCAVSGRRHRAPSRPAPLLARLALGGWLALGSAAWAQAPAEAEALHQSLLEEELGSVPHSSAALSPDPAERARLRKIRAQSTASFTLGQKLESENKLEEALPYYEEAAQADPDFLPITVRRILLLYKLERVKDGLAVAEASLKKTSEPARIHSLLAYGYLLEKRTKEATEHARLALKSDPTLISNYSILVQSLEKNGEKTDLPKLVQESGKADSKDAYFYIRLAELWENLLKNSTEMSPSDLYKQVAPFYQKALALNPKDAGLAQRCGDAAFRTQHYADAIRNYDQALALEPKLQGLREKLAFALFYNNENERAARVLEEVLDGNPEQIALYAMLGELYLTLDQLEEAEKNYVLFVKLGKPAAKDYLRLAQVQIQARQPARALETLEKGKLLFPQVPQFFLFEAVALRAEKKYPEALLAFGQAESRAKADPDFLNGAFYFEYAATQERAGNRAKAEELFGKCLELDPKNHQAMNYLGYMWAEKGEKLKEAEKLLTEALKQDPENPAYLDSMAWIYHQQKNHAKAKTLMLKALALMGEDSVMNEHMGDICAALGENENARKYWQLALKNTENATAIQAKLDQAGASLARQKK